MKKSKIICIFLTINLAFSPVPYHVSAIQFSNDGLLQSVDMLEREREDQELENETGEEDLAFPVLDDDTTDSPEPEEYIEEIASLLDIEIDTVITIPENKCLVLNQDGRYKITAASPNEIDWDDIQDYYNQETSIIIDGQASIGCEGTVNIGKIESGNGDLTILPGSSLNIQSINGSGIEVDKLTIGTAQNNAARTKLRVAADSVGILANTIDIHNTDLNITAKDIGISYTDSHSDNPEGGFLTLNQSAVSIRSNRSGTPGVYMYDVTLTGGKMDVVSAAGTGIIAGAIYIKEEAVLDAKSEQGSDNQGIVTDFLYNNGSVTGTALTGNCGVRVTMGLVIDDCNGALVPVLNGEAKAGYGILLGSDNHLIPLNMEGGNVTGKIEDGIGIRCGAINLSEGSGAAVSRQVNGSAVQGYGISADSMTVAGNGWSVTGQAQKVSGTNLFNQTWLPRSAGILIADTLDNGSVESVLRASGGKMKIEGLAPVDAADSSGIFAASKDSSISLGRIELAATDKDIIMKAAGGTGIYTQVLQVEEAYYVGDENEVFITAEGMTNGIQTEKLFINGKGAQTNANEYRIKAKGRNGSGIVVQTEYASSLAIFGASIEAAGDKYGFCVKNSNYMHIDRGSIKATGTGTGSIAGLYIDIDPNCVPFRSSMMATVNITQSHIIAESKNYGWYSQNCMVEISPGDITSQNGFSRIDAIGAEVGMKLGFDPQEYSLSEPILKLSGEQARDLVVVRAVAKSVAPDRAVTSALDYDKMPSGNVNDPDTGVQVDCATIIEEYQTKVEQPIKTIPIWPYAKNLNLGKIMNYTWELVPATSNIVIGVNQNGITCVQGSGDSNMEISRFGGNNIQPEADEPIVLSAAEINNGTVEVEDSLHRIILRAAFGSTGGNGGGGGGGTTATASEHPSTEATTESTVSSEVDPEIDPAGSTEIEENESGVPIDESGAGTNTGKGSGKDSKKPGIKPPVSWKNGRPNTGDIYGQYLPAIFSLLTVISGVYIYMLKRRKHKTK